MPKERGKHKQYLTRNVPIPSRTIRWYKQQTQSTQATTIQSESSIIRSDQIETTLDKSFADLSYIKSWNCDTCKKKFEQLKNRFQREFGEVVEVMNEKNEEKKNAQQSMFILLKYKL
jgi:hypothetical protein